MEFLRNLNLPNRLTLLRIIMIPIFVFFILIAPDSAACRVIAALIFVAASLTDTADGYIARKYDMITNFGKFMDPLADKVLVSTAMIILVEIGMIPSWVAAIILAREFIISGFRLVAVEQGVVIAASYIAKFKTVFQMFMCIFLIFSANEKYQGGFFEFIHILGKIAMWGALVLTVVSLVDYMYKNREVIKDK